MKRYYPIWGLFAVVFIFGPVAWRVLSWERQQPTPVDTDMAKAGEVLFKHEWQANDPLSPGGDGLGPVFNARSCVACHNQGGVGGGGGVDHNVTTYLVLGGDGSTPLREGVVHAHAISEKYRETLKHVDPSLPEISQPKLGQIVFLNRGDLVVNGRPVETLTLPSNVRLSMRNTPALFGAGLIDLIPDRVILANERAQRLRFAMAPGDTESVPVGRIHRLANGQIGRFGWKAQTARLGEFVQAACSNELGLGNPGQAQPTSMAQMNYQAKGLDLTQKQCDQITAFVAALPRPVERPNAQAEAGKNLFTKVGCADCHTPNMGSVEGIYSDLLLHRMGPTLEGGSAYYGNFTPATTTPSAADIAAAATRPLPDEWRTPPLWGIADSAPYLHDGRATTLKDAIQMHGGQGAGAARRFERLSGDQQAQVIAFLHTLRAP